MESGGNPRDAKIELALEIVERFHDRPAAGRARQAFADRFARGALPEDMPLVELTAGEDGRPIANVLVEAGLTDSTSDSHRMVKAGAVRLDGERVADGRVRLEAGATVVLQVGKRRVARVALG